MENEKQWKHWEEKFVNYARYHTGASGVPLAYVIREYEETDINFEHLDLINKTVACAPLEGEYYIDERMSVFNMVVSFTAEQPSGDWIKTTMKHPYRKSMETLCRNFSGEANATRNLVEAEWLNESLNYPLLVLYGRACM